MYLFDDDCGGSSYSRTVLTFVLKIVTLVLVDSCYEFNIFFNYTNAILSLTSVSDSHCLSVVLPRYVTIFTSSRASLTTVI
ncbi:unnamed protein product [Schistosoma margrebowiei]|uniref:Uncharacterized protein n=1 Tax=Schistosoma margrebowiei TaxID=48269 RepID=A0A183M213_9TREM|nr:unnamed protein product [Schistosoma margrebowiei]